MRKHPYELSAAARLDLLQTWNYLAEHASLKVADKLLADIERAIRTIAKNPGHGHSAPTSPIAMPYSFACILI